MYEYGLIALLVDRPLLLWPLHKSKPTVKRAPHYETLYTSSKYTLHVGIGTPAGSRRTEWPSSAEVVAVSL